MDLDPYQAGADLGPNYLHSIIIDEDLHCLFDKTEFTTNCSTVNESSIYFFFLFLYCCCLLTILFSKLTFSKASFRNTVRLSNSLDPDQVGADLGPNYLHSKKIDEDLHCLFDKAMSQQTVLH